MKKREPADRLIQRALAPHLAAWGSLRSVPPRLRRHLALLGAALVAAGGGNVAAPFGASALLPDYPFCSATLPLGTPPCFFTGDLHFEMDGNQTADTTTGTDWNTPGLGATHWVDGTGPSDDGFVSGSKWVDQSTWSCSASHASEPKDDLLNGDVLFRNANLGTPQVPNFHQVFFFDFTRAAANGDTFVDFEFSRSGNTLAANPPGCNGSVPVRSTGDVTITFTFTNGGAVAGIAATRWDCSITPCNPNNINLGTLGTDWVTALSNPSTFGEGAVDLSLSGLGPFLCHDFASIWMDTRSAGSGSPSELKDFVQPIPFQLGTCSTPTVATAAATTPAQSLGSVALGSTSLDTATVTGVAGQGFPTGAVDFHLCGPSTAGFDPSVGCASGGTDVGSVSTAVGSTVGGLPVETFVSPSSAAITQVGTYCWRADYTAATTGNYLDASHYNATSECFTVVKNTVGIGTVDTVVNGTGALGHTTIEDVATLTGTFGSPATAENVSFSLYGPFATGVTPSCGGTPVYGPVTGLLSGAAGTWTATSPSFTPTAAGTYDWVASFAGDATNTSATEACNVQSEEIQIPMATPQVTTTRSLTGGIVGTDVLGDSATVAGGFGISGESVTFKLYGPFSSAPAGTFCGTATAPTSGAVFTGAGILAGVNPDGPWTTPTVSAGTVSSTGTYYWVAYYAGDANNVAARSGCLDEPVTIGPRTPSVATTRSLTSGTVGTDVFGDSATITGGLDLSGQSVTFKLYGPFTTTPASSFCGTATAPASPAVFTGSGILAGVNPGGPWSTPTVTAGTLSSTGTYYWVAYYAGDGNDVAARSGCLDEPITVNNRTPIIATVQTPAGGAVNLTTFGDLANVTAGFGLSGETVRFNLYGPFATTPAADFCGTGPTGTTPATGAVFSQTTQLGGTGLNGPWSASISDPSALTAIGTYYWVVYYDAAANQDTNNGSARSTCLGEPVTVGDAHIDISPGTAVNAVGAPHVLTAHVSVNLGNGLGWVAAPDGTLVSWTLSSGPGSLTAPTCSSLGGTCQVTLSSGSAGVDVIHASALISVNGVNLTRATGDGISTDGADAGKTFVDAAIAISPTSAVNEVGNAHQFTVTVTALPGGNAHVTPAFGAPAITITPAGSASSGCASLAVTANPLVATCVLTIDSATAGAFTINAADVVTFTDSDPGAIPDVATVTRSTAGNAGPGGSGAAVKHFVDAAVAIGPPTATNTVTDPHVFSVTVTALPAGATPVVFGAIVPSVSPAPGTMSTTCGSPVIVADVATCTVTIDSGVIGTFIANVSATVTMGGVTVTRSTSGNAGPGGSGSATKIYVAPQSAALKGERDLGAGGTTGLTQPFVTSITSALSGDVLEYQLVYSNSGNGPADNVVVTDPVPAGTDYLSCLAATGFSCAQSAGTVSFGAASSIPAGTVGMVVGTFQVRINATGAFSISNTAAVSSRVEPSRSSNSVLAVGPLSSVLKDERDLGIDAFRTTAPFVLDVPNAGPGDVIEYRLTYQNKSNGIATGVVLTDLVPAHTTLLAASCAATTTPPCATTGLLPGSKLTWTLGTEPAGAVVPVTFRVVLDSTFPPGTTTLTNVAVLVSAAQGTQSSNQVTAEVLVSPVLACTSSSCNLPNTGLGMRLWLGILGLLALIGGGVALWMARPARRRPES